jgi:C1A family cysteine protease
MASIRRQPMARQVAQAAGRANRTLAMVTLLAFFVTLAGFGWICQSARAAPRTASPSAPQFSLAPVNPAFTHYLELRRLGRLGSSLNEYGTGEIPLPIDFSYLRGVSAPRATATTFPSSYDLRALSRVSPVEDQGQYDTCWAFADMGSLESCLMPGVSEVFSEDNLILNSGFDCSFDKNRAYDHGGNSLMSAAYLARWAGPVDAAQDAYGDGITPPGLVAERHVQDVLFLPARTGWNDNDAIKSAVMAYGGGVGRHARRLRPFCRLGHHDLQRRRGRLLLPRVG